MRIAQVAPLAESVPPKLYGGTERVVSWLTEDLVRLGHDVTLFACADSLTSASLVLVWPQALRLSRPTPDPYAPYSVLLDKLAERAPNFDIVHCHTDWLHLPLQRCLRVPFLTTLHGRLDLDYVQTAMRSFPEAPFVSISDKQRAPVPDAIGLPQFTMACQPQRSSPVTSQIAIWFFSAVSRRRKVQRPPSDWRNDQGAPCVSPRRFRGARANISRTGLSRCSTVRVFNSSAK
jgi:glycosyltransferase involved in cell wall biosynthesis